MAHSVLLMFFTLGVILATANGFFLYSSNNNKKPPADTRAGGQYGYSTRDGQPPGGFHPWVPQPYSFDSPVTVALPVAVPVQAQNSMMGNYQQMGQQAPTTLQGTIHNVQLVPCLCPITRDPAEAQNPQNQNAAYLVQSQPVQTAP